MNNYDIKCKVIEEELRSIWPEWHVICRLGGGAFGDVFQISKENYGIRVDSALKVIQVSNEMATMPLSFNSPDDTEDEDVNQSNLPDSLRKEIQIMEALRGAPNIVSIEDFYFKQEGPLSSLFVRMELLTSLKELLSGKDGQHNLTSIREIRKLGKDICSALMHCEKRGIIHRDIKPANLFVDEFGHYKVGDFGSSKRMDTVYAAHTMTRVGTISYMAPEIFRGQAYNNTVDIYSLGLVLYQLLNNERLPFLPPKGSYTEQDIDNSNYMRLHGTPLPNLEGKYVGGERIDSRLDAVVRKACAMDPGDRYQTAKEFYDALILTETEVKNEAETEIKQQRTPPLQRPLQTEEKKEGRSAVKKSLIGFVPLLILFILVMGILLSKRGCSSDADTDNATQTEEKKGGDLSRVTAPKDESSEVIEIPDPVLKNAIQDALEIMDQEITKADALLLTSLFYDGSNGNQIIEDISGLSEFVNLTELSLVNNQISDISELSGLTDLTYLDLGDNQISDISVLSGLTNLTYLRLSGNQISDISALSGLTALTDLLLNRNQISDIHALSYLTNLTDLYLNVNQISDIITLSGMTDLTHLNLRDNQISDISALSGLTNLKVLYLNENQIGDINALSGMTDLTYLGLGKNQISDIRKLSGLTNLTELYLHENQISDISALSGMTDLTRLSLGENQISDISVLSGMTKLTYIRLSENHISDISALSGMTDLTELRLNRNQISDISVLSGLRKLIVLYLNVNQISDINPLSGLTNLTELYLNVNQISDISALSGLTKLETLQLQGNPVLENKSREEIMDVLSEADNLTNVDF